MFQRLLDPQNDFISLWQNRAAEEPVDIEAPPVLGLVLIGQCDVNVLKRVNQVRVVML